MGEIIISVKNKKKLELLKRFLESVEYVDSVEDFNDEHLAKPKKLSKYEKLLYSLEAACEYNDDWIATEDLTNKLKESNLLTRTTGDNYVSFLRDFLEFLFGTEHKIPKNTDDIFSTLPDDSKTILEYIKKNFISTSAFEHALPIKINDCWLIEPSDIVEYIDEILEEKGISNEIYREESKNPVIPRTKFVEWFQDKTDERN